MPASKRPPRRVCRWCGRPIVRHHLGGGMWTHQRCNRVNCNGVERWCEHAPEVRRKAKRRKVKNAR